MGRPGVLGEIKHPHRMWMPHLGLPGTACGACSQLPESRSMRLGRNGQRLLACPVMIPVSEIALPSAVWLTAVSAGGGSTRGGAMFVGVTDRAARGNQNARGWRRSPSQGDCLGSAAWTRPA
jgi:hypothetical protein